jgi:hypothetical protein
LGGLGILGATQQIDSQFTGCIVGYQIKTWFFKVVHNIDWLMQAMDVTQWGMVAVTVVVLGFLALKTRR